MLLIVVIVLATLLVAAELLARSILPGIVRGIVVDQLELPADQQLEVHADGILLPQLVTGNLDSLHLSSDAVTIGGITGAADITATGIPLRGGDLSSATGTVRIDQDQFAGLLATSDLPIESVTLDAPNATLSGTVPVLGFPVSIALTLTPGADAGELLLTPVALQVAGVDLDAAEISGLGDIGAQLTQPQRICIADRLPAGLTVTGIEVRGTEVVVDLDADGAIVTDATLQQNGNCP